VSERERLPNRRPNQTFELIHDNTTFAVTIGYDPATKEAREVFTHGAKVGSMMELRWRLNPATFQTAFALRLPELDTTR